MVTSITFFPKYDIWQKVNCKINEKFIIYDLEIIWFYYCSQINKIFYCFSNTINRYIEDSLFI